MRLNRTHSSHSSQSLGFVEDHEEDRLGDRGEDLVVVREGDRLADAAKAANYQDRQSQTVASLGK